MTDSAFHWPAGRAAALSVTFDLDAESVVLAVDAGYARRPSVISHQAYGPLTGLPRLLGMLADRSLRATFFVPGFSAERHPAAVEAILAGGHEVAHHGYLHRPPASLSEAEEREEIERGLAALEHHGVRPGGYRSPWWDVSPRTLGLLAEYGFAYDASLFDRDTPYPIATEAGVIVEVPQSWVFDDWERYAFLPDPPAGQGVIEQPSRVAEAWWEEIEGYRRTGGCAVLVNHPFLSGRPARTIALGDLLDRALEAADLWVAPMEEIAAHAAGLGLDHIEVDLPRL